MSKENFEKTLRFFADGGAIPRGLATDLIQQYDWAQVELAKEPQPSAEAAEALAAAIDADPEHDTIELTDADVTLDDETTTVGSKKRGKLKV